MVRKAFVVTAILIVALIVVISTVSIISLVNRKPIEFRSVVTYDSKTNAIVDANYAARIEPNNDLPVISTLLSHEKTIMAGSIIVIIIFALLFYGAKRSKS